MLDDILEVWRTNEGINRLMLENIPDAGLAAIPLLKNGQPGKGRDVGRQIAHMIGVRVSHMTNAEKVHMKGIADLEKGETPTRAHLAKALDGSSRGVEALFTRIVTDGTLVRKRGPLLLLAYLISHESHHRGSILLALKQNAFAPSEELRWGLWSRWFSGES